VPPVAGADVYFTDVYFTDVYFTDVYFTDVHFTDVHFTDVHSAGAYFTLTSIYFTLNGFDVSATTLPSCMLTSYIRKV